MANFVRIRNSQLQVDLDGAASGANFLVFADLSKFKPYAGVGDPATDGSDFVAPLAVVVIRSSCRLAVNLKV